MARDALTAIGERLTKALHDLPFAPPVTAVYNPLVYARDPHGAYNRRFGGKPKEVLLLGMNPGPWGMAQTGIPFGEVAAVRDWMGITGGVDRPPDEHPRRPVEGFHCQRSEVSGRRLWGWAADRFGTPERFFQRYFVANYCPLIFLEESGRNRTPDKLPAAEREPLFVACDRALQAVVEWLEPRWVLGVGRFAEGRARQALGSHPVRIGNILHPSPASPAANAGWAEAVEIQLEKMGIPSPG
jgi:single-strand selective monofunctional uracil DNA glycosylase